MDVEVLLSRENCEGCATSCKLSPPSCFFGKAAAGERREELALVNEGSSCEDATPLVD